MNKILQLHLSVADITPSIWRRVLVADNSTLDEVHALIQACMDWEDMHEHEFVQGSRRFAEDFEDAECEDESLTEIGELLKRKGESLRYLYDLGDRWNITLTLEKLQDAELRLYPCCLAGENAGPLEDCGGVADYQAIVEAFQVAPKERNVHEQELVEWAGEEFDPSEFDAQTVNEEIESWENSADSAYEDLKETMFEHALTLLAPNDVLQKLDVSYDVESAKTAEQWLSIDQFKRVLGIAAYHNGLSQSTPDKIFEHALLHDVIESMLATGSVQETNEQFERCLRAGMSRHDAIHVIGDSVRQAMGM